MMQQSTRPFVVSSIRPAPFGAQEDLLKRVCKHLDNVALADQSEPRSLTRQSALLCSARRFHLRFIGQKHHKHCAAQIALMV